MNQGVPGPVLISAKGLALSYPGMDVFKDLSFELRPGLTLIRGGDGRGKTGLLQILAGVRKVASGTLHRPPLTVHWVDPQDDRDEAVIASQWLQSRRGAFADWDEAVAQHCVESFALTEHLHKALFMLSTGTRRKLGLTAAFACGAQLVLLDMPCAALDIPSCEALIAQLTEVAAAAAQSQQVWVIADYDLPDGLAMRQLSGVIDLGD
jgi:ATPase subunit of ABC transporter with duplicated ATPase domains